MQDHLSVVPVFVLLTKRHVGSGNEITEFSRHLLQNCFAEELRDNQGQNYGYKR